MPNKLLIEMSVQPHKKCSTLVPIHTHSILQKLYTGNLNSYHIYRLETTASCRELLISPINFLYAYRLDMHFKCYEVELNTVTSFTEKDIIELGKHFSMFKYLKFKNSHTITFSYLPSGNTVSALILILRNYNRYIYDIKNLIKNIANNYPLTALYLYLNAFISLEYLYPPIYSIASSGPETSMLQCILTSKKRWLDDFLHYIDKKESVESFLVGLLDNGEYDDDDYEYEDIE